MARLMPACPAPLTLPVAAIAKLDPKAPAWLSDCLSSVREEYLNTLAAAPYDPGTRREFHAHEAEAVREMLIDAWLDALCPRLVFSQPKSAAAPPKYRFSTGGRHRDQ